VVAFRSVAVPLLGGGALLAGYATVAWLRGRPERRPGKPAQPGARDSEPAPRSGTFVRGLEPLELDLEQELNESHHRANEHAAKIGSLFLGRALEAFSPFEAPPVETATERDPLDFEEEEELDSTQGGATPRAAGQ